MPCIGKSSYALPSIWKGTYWQTGGGPGISRGGERKRLRTASWILAGLTVVGALLSAVALIYCGLQLADGMETHTYATAVGETSHFPVGWIFHTDEY